MKEFEEAIPLLDELSIRKTKGDLPKEGLPTAADILDVMADTYRERNKVYGDNFRIVGPVLSQLHPEGVLLRTPQEHEIFHLWSLIIVKLSRFATSGLTHQDSIHDAGVYCAMIEAILKERGGKA